jgi:hypothetical protein
MGIAPPFTNFWLRHCNSGSGIVNKSLTKSAKEKRNHYHHRGFLPMALKMKLMEKIRNILKIN